VSAVVSTSNAKDERVPVRALSSFVDRLAGEVVGKSLTDVTVIISCVEVQPFWESHTLMFIVSVPNQFALGE
jgi:hypothetical protein